MHYFRKDLIDKKPVNVNVPHKKVMMCLNESTLNPFEVLKKEIISKLEQVPLNRYFNNITLKLQTTLAEYAQVHEENIIYGNGADEMLFTVFNSVRDNNDSFAVSLSPSYFDYKSYSRAVGLNIKFMNLDENYDFSVDKYCELADDDNCKLVILCNPNNPTGNLLDDEKVIEVIKQNSQRIVMIDETYFEFSGKTFKDRIDEFPNLVIVRSFSKAFSAAGLRFGYIISRKENINEFKKIMTIFHSSMMIQATVLTMLENKEIFLEQVAETNRQKKIVFEELSNLHAVTVKKSATNFLAFTIGENTIDLFNFLSDNDIALRNIGAHPLLKNYIRVTICNEEENKLFVEKVREYFILTQRDSNTEKI